MRIVIQRVSKASVSINQQTTASIEQGLLVLLGITHNDTAEDVLWLVKKLLSLRIFNDDNGVMNKSITEINGEILLVSQFTLMASCRKGNRPSWIQAAKHETAIPLYQHFIEQLNSLYPQKVRTGEFGADMQIALVNDGPVTICIDSKNKE